MATASLRVDLRSRGADLHTIARELRAMDDAKVTALFRRRLEDAARPFPAAVRASVMAIPAKRPPSPTGLRARIAACAEVASWSSGRQVSVAVEMDPRKMPPGQMSLPLMEEGAKRWKHPVFARRGTPRKGQEWVNDQPPHPYFYQAAASFGLAAGAAMRAALEDITRQISG